MKPKFALDLSHEGIVLLHRSPRGKWTTVGDVPLDDPNLRENLSFLRSTAVGLEGKGFGTKLVIPESQILYLSINAPGPGEEKRRIQIAAGLVGKTPYDVDDLIFDWAGKGATVDVAVVAKETLDEAEEFAVEHRFNPISFVGRTTRKGADWEPFFGRTDYSFAFLGNDVDVRDDGSADEFSLTDGSDLLFEEGSINDPATDASKHVVPTENLFVDPPVQPQNHSEDAAHALPAFSSRRDSMNGGDSANAQRPIDRVSPRIALGIQPQTPTTGVAPTVETGTEDRSAAPSLSAEAVLRTSLVEDIATPSLTERLKALIAGLGGRPVTGLKDLGAKTLNAASAAGDRVRQIRPRPPKRRPTAEGAADPLESSPFERNSEGGFGTRKNVVIGAAAVLAILLTLGAAYMMFGPRQSVVGTSSLVPADNGRSPDATGLASGADSAGNVTIPPLRPQRRSKFEGGVDPDAGKPDTVRPVTELSDKERADINATGLPAPTDEELAEGGDDDAEATQAAIDAAYKESGVQQGVVDLNIPENTEERDDIYVASVDRRLEANDAIILPDFNSGPQDDQPRKRMSPLGPLITFDLDGNGMVKPSRDGTINPDGILVYLGKPAITPPEKPKTDELVPPDPLRAQTPKARPADLKTGTDAIYVQGTLTEPQLRAKRARARPESAQDLQPGEVHTPTELAVLTSFQPSHRPSDFAKIVEKTTITVAAGNATDAVPQDDGEPDTDTGLILPTRASVAKQATIKNALNPSQLNLIGVYGTPSKRRALLRLPSGRFVKVEIGDRVDGGRVAAIDVDSLSLIKSGRNRVLKIPQ